MRAFASLSCLASFAFLGCASVGVPSGFVEVAAPIGERKAVAADSSLFWSRSFDVARGGDLGFWTTALEAELVEERGYALVERRAVTVGGREAVELTFESSAGGRPQRYFLTLWTEGGPLDDEVFVVEFLAAPDAFDAHVAAVREAIGG
jgi:hypothetical protein